MKVFIYLFLAVIAFTTFEPFSKLITDSVSAEAITGIRFILGGIMLFPLALRDIKKKNIHLTWKDCLQLAGLGILCICVSMLSLQFAVKFAPSPAVIAIVFSVNSVITLILASFVLKEKITLFKALATLACLFGIGIMFDPKAGANSVSIFFALLAAVTFSLFTVFSKKVNERLTPIITSAVSFSIGGAILFVFSYIVGKPIIGNIDFQVVWVIVYLAIAVTGIGYIAFFKVMEIGSAMAASFVFFIKPILTPFVTWAVNGIVPDYKVFIALGFILIGSYLGLYKK